MEFKFFFFVTLFIVFSCSEKNIEKKQSQTQIDYYQFREVNLVSFGIPATLMIPNETAGIGASFEPKIYHDDGGFKWHINVGRHFNIHIEDYGDYQYLMPEFLNKKFNTSSEMCDSILKDTGVALLPGSDFGFDQDQMLARLSFTDFDGQEFMNKIEDNQKIDNDKVGEFAPKIVQGVDNLKKWSESI